MQKNNIHGDVCICVIVGILSEPFSRDNFKAELNAEFCAIKLINTNIYFVTTYSSCTGNFETYLKSFDGALSKLFRNNILIVIMHDFNII